MNSPSPAIAPLRIAFLGLGVMGFAMAGHLSKSQHQLVVYNRSPEKAIAWAQSFGAQIAKTPSQAVTQANLVISCVSNDAALRSIVFDAALCENTSLAAIEQMQSGATWIDHSTVSVQLAQELDLALRARACHFIDAPVSGGNVGAQNGTLTVLCGGDALMIERMRPIMLSYARAVTRLGACGAGQLGKMVNQICIAGIVQGLSEGIAFGLRASLDVKALLEALAQGAAQSWQMQNRGNTMVDQQFDFGFAVDLMRKDLGLVLEQAKRQGSALPMTALIDQFYADVQQQGGGRWDTSSLIKRLL